MKDYHMHRCGPYSQGYTGVGPTANAAQVWAPQPRLHRCGPHSPGCTGVGPTAQAVQVWAPQPTLHRCLGGQLQWHLSQRLPVYTEHH